ncbi:MAG: TOBE domain-containing protein, partial [Tistlia sp.]
LVQAGTPVECYFRPVDAFAAAFFGEVNRLWGRVEGGRVRTPLAALDAGGLPEGAEVEVLVRPEGLRLLPPGGGGGAPGERSDGLGDLEARVIAARLLGRTSLVHLSLQPAEGAALHLYARVPGRFLPDDGDLFSLALDPAQVFVFPATGPISVQGATGAAGAEATGEAVPEGGAAVAETP